MFLSGVLAGVGFSAGFYAGTESAAADSVAEVTDLQAQVVSQRDNLQSLRDNARREIDALALKLGQLNANVIRMNALGRRLTDMADLDQGEFDFDSAPAVGGPATGTLVSNEPHLSELLTEMDSLDDTLQVLSRPLSPWGLELVGFHPLGTARMANTPNEGVIDMDQQAFELPGLYVADGSVTPTSLGVNPQLTIMALATMAAQKLGASL